MNIRNLQQKGTVLDRNQMKSLTGGMCASTFRSIMIYLRHGDKNQEAQADVIQGMVDDGTIVLDYDC